MPTLHCLPLISANYAAFLGLFAVALTINVIAHRVRLNVEAGDGGIASMAQAIRAHANFAEHVPLALLLLVLAELSAAAPLALHILGGGLVLARLLNAWGLSRSLGPTMPRQAGAGLTLLVTAAAAGLILYKNLVGW
jgi:uncharacterized protein